MSVIIKHNHHWRCENYEWGILRQTCDCGAVRFEASYYLPDKRTRARLEILNKERQI